MPLLWVSTGPFEPRGLRPDRSVCGLRGQCLATEGRSLQSPGNRPEEALETSQISEELQELRAPSAPRRRAPFPWEAAIYSPASRVSIGPLGLFRPALGNSWDQAETHTAGPLRASLVCSAAIAIGGLNLGRVRKDSEGLATPSAVFVWPALKREAAI